MSNVLDAEKIYLFFENIIIMIKSIEDDKDFSGYSNFHFIINEVNKKKNIYIYEIIC